MSTFAKGSVSFLNPYSETSNQGGWSCQQPDRTRSELRTLDTSPNIFTLHENSVTVNVKHRTALGICCHLRHSRWSPLPPPSLSSLPLLRQAKLFLKSIICTDWNNDVWPQHRGWSESTPTAEKLKNAVKIIWWRKLANLMYPLWETLKQWIY